MFLSFTTANWILPLTEKLLLSINLVNLTLSRAYPCCKLRITANFISRCFWHKHNKFRINKFNFTTLKELHLKRVTFRSMCGRQKSQLHQNSLLQMGRQSLDEFVWTNVFHCHTTGHLLERRHTAIVQRITYKLDGALTLRNSREI